MSAKEKARKIAVVKAIEADFVRRFRVVLLPMKAAIRNEIKKGKSAHQAVDHVFREHDICGHLKKLVSTAAIKAVKYG